MRRLDTLLLVITLGLGLVAVGCGGEDPAPEANAANAPAANRPAPVAPEVTTPPAADAAPADLNPLLNPSSPAINLTAPERFRVLLDTTKGEVTIEVHREWAPLGADRFYSLVRNGFYDGTRFFRVMSGFVAQFGISGDPDVSAVWRDAAIPDDADRESNHRGRITFATGGPNSRTTQLFINLGDNLNLDLRGFPPFGEVVDGMAAVQSLYSGYGETPNQGRIQSQGNRYLERDFDRLDYIRTARIVGER